MRADYLIAVLYFGGLALEAAAFLIFVIGGIFDIASGDANYVYAAGPPLVAGIAMLGLAFTFHCFFLRIRP